MFVKPMPLRFSHNLFRKGCNDVNSPSVKRFSSKENVAEPDISMLLEDAATFCHAKDPDWSTTPYPATAQINGTETYKKPTIDPKDTCIFLFPGQGILKVGKINEYLNFPHVKDMFEIAKEALGYNILKICQHGPQHVLNKTEFNQPATVLTSLAAIEKLKDERPKAVETCVSAAGYSVGEITSLIFSGSLSFEDGIRLVGIRAAAMQHASDQSAQGMLSAFCSPGSNITKACSDAEAWAQDLGVQDPLCRVAIFLYTQTKVIAGSDVALQYLEKNKKILNLRLVKRLPVSGAFHTPLMMPALRPFKRALETVSFNKPRIRVYSNYTSLPHTTEFVIKKQLAQQLIGPVKWEQILQKIYDREAGMAYPRTFDIGSLGTMKTILRNVNAKAWDTAYSV